MHRVAWMQKINNKTCKIILKEEFKMWHVHMEEVATAFCEDSS